MTTFLAFLDQAVPLLWRASWQKCCSYRFDTNFVPSSQQAVAFAWLAFRPLGGFGPQRACWLPVIPAGPLSLFRLTASMDLLWQPVRDRAVRQILPVAESPGRDLAGISRPPVDRDLLSVLIRPGPSRLQPGPTVDGALCIPHGRILSVTTAGANRYGSDHGFPACVEARPWMAVAVVRLRRRSRKWSLAHDPSHLALFDACRRTMGVRRPVRLRATADGLGQAVTGLVRSCVIVPQTVLASASLADLEHTLLHELAHVRRWDVAVQWVVTAVGIIHWFKLAQPVRQSPACRPRARLRCRRAQAAGRPPAGGLREHGLDPRGPARLPTAPHHPGRRFRNPAAFAGKDRHDRPIQTHGRGWGWLAVDHGRRSP